MICWASQFSTQVHPRLMYADCASNSSSPEAAAGEKEEERTGPRLFSPAVPFQRVGHHCAVMRSNEPSFVTSRGEEETGRRLGRASKSLASLAPLLLLFIWFAPLLSYPIAFLSLSWSRRFPQMRRRCGPLFIILYYVPPRKLSPPAVPSAPVRLRYGRFVSAGRRKGACETKSDGLL